MRRPAGWRTAVVAAVMLAGSLSATTPATLATAIAKTFAKAFAKEGDVIREGTCSRRSDWKLKLSPENGRIEVEFEVDQNRSGRTWRVRMWHDGVRFFKGRRTTRPPSGSFEVRRVRPNRSGVDFFRARAFNPRSGEVCRGRARF
jgi:hypothetical protein